MKIIRYIDIYPGATAENVYFFSDPVGLDKFADNKRYRLELELPDYPEPVEGVITSKDVKVKEIE